MGEATGTEMQVGLPPSVLSPHRPLIRADPAPSLPALSLLPTKPSARKSTWAWVPGPLGLPSVAGPRRGGRKSGAPGRGQSRSCL